MFSDEKLFQAGQKTTTKYWYKIFYSNTSYGLEYEKAASVNYLLRCSKTQSSKSLCLPNASEF